MRLIPISCSDHWPVCHGGRAKTRSRQRPPGFQTTGGSPYRWTPTNQKGHTASGVAPAKTDGGKPLRGPQRSKTETPFRAANR